MYTKVGLSINYNKYDPEKFKIVSPELYNFIKTKVQLEDGFKIQSINSKNEYNSNHLLKLLIKIFALLVILILLWVLGTGKTHFDFGLIGVGLFLGSFFGIIGLLISLYNFLRYLHFREKYFNKMKNDLLISKDFFDFLDIRRENYLLIDDKKSKV
jgi:TRAP-type mannitol/chloroaromatic compound transport system permease large subunit